MELLKGGRPPKKLDDKQIAQVEALVSFFITRSWLATYAIDLYQRGSSRKK